ncbi:virion protein G11 [Vespertilionid gammaherpesvirus 1]|uniref:Virion protein G11 n=1 Tax=Vespertilionid gammaherpesvirus 1 TaxID=2560830 RepID=A0A109QD50_9GAMA|nr:virion protein G11 [Myotis gammaherpesvirus 8]AMA67372.1 virion protein G11 [Vespertilionid gammaherpesvirus 1]
MISSPTFSRSLLTRTFRSRNRHTPFSECPTGSSWDFTIYDTYIKFTNNENIQPPLQGMHELPFVPRLCHILKNRHPDFFFTSVTSGGVCSQVMFMISGCVKNYIPTDIFFIESSSEDIAIRSKVLITDTIPKNTLTFYMFFVTVVKPSGLYLEILKDTKQIDATVTCAQEGAMLTSKQPQVFICGHTLHREYSRLPFLLTQKTRPLKNTYCRIHVAHDTTCPVNAVKAGKHFVRVSVEHSVLRSNSTKCLKVAMTTCNETILAFRFNPYVFSGWKWAAYKIPIHYVGPPMILSSRQTIHVTYNNCYTTPLIPDITALILNDPENKKYFISECEWTPKNSAKISVTNKTCFLKLLHTGDYLGYAVFLIVPKFHLANMLPAKYRDNMTTALCLPAGLTLNATKLKKIK